MLDQMAAKCSAAGAAVAAISAALLAAWRFGGLVSEMKNEKWKMITISAE